MLLIRLTSMVLVVVALAVVAFVADSEWLVIVALLALIAATAGTALLIMHYTGAASWLGPDDEITLEDSDLVERDTGLPKRERFSSRLEHEYAADVARRGLVAVPDGWRGPEGAHRVLLVATAPVTPEQLSETLGGWTDKQDLAVLVVVPTLARSERRFLAGDATEAVAHAEKVARDTVAGLRAADIHVSGHIGPADPAVALADGLRTYDAERVLVMREHDGARRYLEDVPVDEAADTFHVPVTELTR